jgi:hypothetical protein
MIKENSHSNTAQAMWVALGSLASFGLTIISSMILSRYFNKVDYGTYKQVMYVYNTCLFVFTLGLPKSFGYFLPRVPLEEGYSLVNKITRIFFGMGTFFSLLLFMFAPQLSVVLKNPDLEVAIRLFSPVPFLMLPTMGLEAIYSTYRKTYISSMYVVITRLVMLLCLVMPTILFQGDYKLAIIGFVTASAFDFAFALYLKNRPFRNVEKHRTTISYKSILQFSIPLMYASLWGTIIKSSDQFFISRYFGQEIFAEFTNGFIELPFIGMIIGACSTVLFPLFSKLDHEQSDPKTTILPLWISVFKKTAMLIYPLLAFCWVFADDIMIVLYGHQYEVSAIYFRIIQIANIFTLIVYAPLILALGKTKYYANVHMVIAFILVILEYLSVNFIDSSYMIAIISVTCNVGKTIALLALVAKCLQVKIIELFPVNLLLKILLLPILFLFTYRLLVNFENSFINLLFGGMIYVFVYLLYAKLVGIDYMKLILPFLQRKMAK